MVISSEEAIAKGIRRIVALTGPEATKALKKAELLQNRLHEIKRNIANDDKCLSMKENVRKIVELNEDVSHAVIPYWKKDEMRAALKDLKKKLDDKERAAKAAVAVEVVETVRQKLEANVGVEVFVEEVEAFSNTKALDSALKKIKALSPTTSALLLSVDRDVGKIFALSAVSKPAISKGLKADEWVKAIVPLMNGKGGGKSESAQASGTNVSANREILEKARDFANAKLGTVAPAKSESSLSSVNTSGLLLRKKPGSVRSYRAEIAASFGGKAVTTESVEDSETISLQVGDVTLYNSNAIAFYLSSDALKRTNEDPYERSQVIQWMSYAENHLLATVLERTLPVLGVSSKSRSVKNVDEELNTSLAYIDRLLQSRTYFVGERISLADVAVFTAVLPLYEHVLDRKARNRYGNMTRWFETILNQTEVRSVVKDFKFCEK